MILSIPDMESRADRVRQHAPATYGNEVVTYRSTYTEKAPGVPQVLLVDQEPGAALLPHYHASDQYQVFIDGEGKLGSHPLRPVSVHYTNKYTGYGPIVAGERGVSYYVLRPSADALGHGQYLFRPELREKAKAYPGKKRTLIADGIRVRDPAELTSLAKTESVRLFDIDDDQPDAGILALAVCLGPGGDFAGPDPKSGGGQFYLVLQGSLVQNGKRLRARSGIAVTCGEAAVSLRAGDDGAQVLVMQYPRWS